MGHIIIDLLSVIGQAKALTKLAPLESKSDHDCEHKLLFMFYPVHKTEYLGKR